MRSLLTLLFWAACLAAVSSAAPLTDKSNGKAGDVAPPEDGVSAGLPSRTVKNDEPNHDYITIPAPHVRSIEVPPRDAGNASSSDFNTPTKTSPETAEITNDFSIQILFQKTGNAYGWAAFQGPQGVSVNPCRDTRFKQIVRGAYETHRPLSINNPPYPRAGFKWPIKIEPLTDCRYESHPQAKSPGLLLCGEYMIYDVLADPVWYSGGVINCGDSQFHRAWYVDY